ncbi:transcriptional regulator, AraC family [Gloeocapsa sp. PCC 7428]|uniref:helix-turn-helix transcriptional regulator n=1 Tax=Gloeocapsa sp. PCC 7428 TaxID=1173026 RepID=UPI0002A5EF36|nr:AraC family transcriptional regulator [Gloeocapsa sp. PCC 7428]AFZ28785.1 transcriptional regulator, AraC family [Gloeocapsa sp. PCC 7428]
MAIALSEASWDELWEESWERAYCADSMDECDQIIEYPQQLGQGYKRNIELRNGIILTLHNYRFHDDLTVISTQSEATGEPYRELEFVFNLSSTSRYWQGDYVTSGQHYLVAHGCVGGFYCQELAKQPKLAVDIHLESAVFESILGNSLDILPLDLRQMVESSDRSLMSAFDTITPAMQLALEQILHCPYQGVLKQMYLESKSVELLVLYINQVQSNSRITSKIRLQSDDVDRIHEAKKILIQQIDNPPTLLNLARQVGLNDRKLKQGFRQVFNTTVFGYLHHYRMEKARQLLLEQRSISAIAAAVGYASPTAFNAAFRRKFGTSPKAYQLASRI